MVILAVDYGDTRTGLALCDKNMLLASPAGLITEPGMNKTVIQIVEFAKQNKVDRVVVGLPKNMDGTEGARADLCRTFAQKVEEATGKPVKLWDERRTTVEAHNILSAHNYHGKKRKDTVDAVAASLILEGYLAFRKR